MTSNAAVPTHPERLRARAEEARARLVPERPEIPAPRNPMGVAAPSVLGATATPPPQSVVAALDGLVTRLAAIEAQPDEPAHHALARIGDLTSTGVPDEGWSADEGVTADALVEAAAIAAEVHEQAATVLAGLDEADLGVPAVLIDSLATSLRVIRVVADLEVFAVTRS